MKDFFSNYNIISLIIDIIIIILVLYNIIKSAKQGFVSSFISLILTVISFIFVWPLSGKASSYIYDLYLKNFISGFIKTKLIDTGATTQTIRDFLNKNYLRTESYFGVSFENIDFENIDFESLISYVSSIISDNVVFPIINILMNIIILIIVSFVFSIVIKLLRKIFKCFSYIPILGKFNIFFGGIFGFLKSIVIISFISVIINSLVSVSKDKWDILNSHVIKETYILKLYDEFIKTDKVIDFLDYLDFMKEKF